MWLSELFYKAVFDVYLFIPYFTTYIFYSTLILLTPRNISM